MPILPFWGANYCLTSLHMSKRFICLEETGKRINQFYIGYIIDPGFHVNKAFRDQVEKCMNIIFGELAQSFIKATLSKNNTIMLSLMMFHETRGENPKKYLIVLSFFIYNIIKNYVFIDYLDFQSKN